MHAALCRRSCASRLLAAGRDAPAALRCAFGMAAPSGGGDALVPSASAAATPPPERGGAPPPLYDGHIRLSGVQRAAVAVGSAVGALLAPARADLVAALGCATAQSAAAALAATHAPPLTRRETTGHAALERMRRRMAADPQGRAILADQPRITDATLQACWDMPPGACWRGTRLGARALRRLCLAALCKRVGSFGREYAQFMGVRSFSPAERPPVRFVDDAELAYVAARCVCGVRSELHVSRMCSRAIVCAAGRARCMICGTCCSRATPACWASWR